MENAAPVHGRLYWLSRHVRESLLAWIRAHFKKRPILSTAVAVLLVLFVYSWRMYYQLLIVDLWKHLYIVLFGAPIFYGVYRLFKAAFSSRILGASVRVLGAFALLAAFLIVGSTVHQYISLWWRYQIVDIEPLSVLPTTGYERIQPLNSVASVAREIMSNTYAPTTPEFVRDMDGSYRFTMAVVPVYIWSQVFGSIKSVLSLPATDSTLGFGQNSKAVTAQFDVGDDLWFSHNLHTCVERSFGPWRFFNYEPAQARYMKDDSGQMVTVVSLVRWEGFLFPRPEFGGVQVIRQNEGGLPLISLRFWELVLLGCGTWVPPEEIGTHPFLLGQDLVPVEVSRYKAESFRFQDGFLAPFPGYHVGDIRVPDLPDDMLDPPFVVYLTKSGERVGKLYQYFGLEPFDPDKQGLAVSLFVPADGQGPILVYDHAAKGEMLIGASAVGPKVMETRKQYDWDRNRPVESRPFVHLINGEPRFMWITTVVTIKDREGGRFIAGTAPEVAITDAASMKVTWVDPAAPQTWLQKIEENLHGIPSP